ncbi:hypothetical protein B0A52_03157 [Exophiala mesophila]|uniref:Uncharacterized protein n=1 Tax=Exophiala mesophila TaxID=212818 RepID=A0A438NAK0_EXOME|nr:hypothetical protein B0A52_03157 [Exophiala mesophila]
MATSTTPSHPHPVPTEAQIFEALSRYPFDADSEYQLGLSAILGHPETPATREELVEKADLVRSAECFYFERAWLNRKYNLPTTIDARAYSTWQSNRLPSQAQPTSQPSPQTQQSPAPAPAPSHTDSSLDAQSSQQTANTSSSSTVSPNSQPQSTADEPPPYPTSFAAIVDLITRNIPVPGIEEIPTTVLEPGSSKIDKTPRRRKPWEKDDADAVTESGVGESTESTAASSTVAEQLDHPEAGQAVNSSVDPSASAVQNAASQVDVNGHRETGTGVVNILKPNAIPDSGLLGKD